MVDSSEQPTSFTANPGKITFVSLEVSNPTNSKTYNIYTLTFNMQDKTPTAGYIEVQFPPQIKMKPASTRSTEACKEFTCLDVDENNIKFLVPVDRQADFEKGKDLVLKIGGVTNPRSF